MRELIERYVRELVKIPSTSNTETEKSCADSKISAARRHLWPVCTMGTGKSKERIP